MNYVLNLVYYSLCVYQQLRPKPPFTVCLMNYKNVKLQSMAIFSATTTTTKSRNVLQLII